MEDRWHYLLVLLTCLLVTAPLEALGRGVYRRADDLVRAIGPVVVVFGVWDLVAIARGHWDFNPRFITGVFLPGGAPLEELLFFVVIPLCAVLTYEAVQGTAALVGGRRRELEAVR
ncbi:MULTISPECIES: lycopene cyclase domain-containing protein [Actinosynnema]|uniref:lycopene cyclase domain-containing protein n=1 Tax=Actinosynnema TaxID=40566 RepID=UPI0020A50496|nr:lycopene cyclase domain-containing protein [Actinosynnema pretiosum]MCP2098170.1 lycopene cyclase domain-containing protein [Actinosynnema pretiosum]